MTLDDVLRAVVREEVRPVVEAIRVLAEARAPAADADHYLSVEKAAAMVEVHPDTIRAWVKSGRLPEHRAGRELRIRRDELHRFLDGAKGDTGRATPEEEAVAILSRKRA